MLDWGASGIVAAKGAFHGPASYIRSGSGASSRTHSPLQGAATGYAPIGMYGFPRGHSPVLISGVVPTVAELERHYYELHEPCGVPRAHGSADRWR